MTFGAHLSQKLWIVLGRVLQITHKGICRTWITAGGGFRFTNIVRG
jgi:hypothetical protein